MIFPGAIIQGRADRRHQDSLEISGMIMLSVNDSKTLALCPFRVREQRDYQQPTGGLTDE
ncbi:MAG: hypothetical protein CVU69_13410 [Deltaproteobacteria bacterium HGW-Deltaproteobacteria-4]|nr:MAG: hypothetical protein CVU69_13410 [Deltaproteobacteria bacterium HGW-Deltaproteobacteria-4]